MDKLKALFNLLRKGAAVADPALWKTRQMTATVLGAFLMALVQVAGAFGYDLPISADTATAIAGGFVAVVNVILTLSTSKSVGLPGVQPAGEPLPSPVRGAAGPSEGSGSPSVPGVDAATRARAEAWLAKQTGTNPSDSGFEAP